MKWNSKNIKTSIILFVFFNLLLYLVIPAVIIFFSKHTISLEEYIIFYEKIGNKSFFRNILLFEIFIIMATLYIVFYSKSSVFSSDMVAVTDTIQIPAAAGHGEYGSAKWLSEGDKDKIFSTIILDSDDVNINYLAKEEKEIEKIKIEIDKRDLNQGKQVDSQTSVFSDEQVLEIYKYNQNYGHNKFISNPKLSAATIKKINELKSKGIEFNNDVSSNMSDEKVNVILDLFDFLHKNNRLTFENKKIISRHINKIDYDVEQMKELAYGLQDEVDIELYAKENYSAMQMRELRLGLKAKLDISYYADYRLTAEQMNAIRNSLKTGKEINIKEAKNNNESENNVKEVMPLIKTGGLVLGKEDLKKGKEKIYYLGKDIHSLVVGATGCGKTRSMVLQSLGVLGLAGESMVITDIKGELYDYASPFLKEQGYTIVNLNFKNPLKGNQYNFLQPVIDAVRDNDIGKAIQLTWDITSLICDNDESRSKTEPIWQNGEASIIATGIMAVVYDNMENPSLQNLANVYYFIANMCKTVDLGGGRSIVPLNVYTDSIPDNHPAKQLLAISDIAPSKTRGSFFTSALTSLRLFTIPSLADMTSDCDFNIRELGLKKMAIFLIVPDSRDTYNEVVSLFISQQYQILSDVADLTGGRLKIRVNFLCDEFGSFPAIPGFASKITVSRSKGIRFNLFIQALAQLDKGYGKEVAETIKGNCMCWVYLGSNDYDTLKILSEKLNHYTVGVVNKSTNTQRYSSVSKGENFNLVGRPLLFPNEIERIQRPYSLVFYETNNPAIFKSPDLSKWHFCKWYGMGSPEKDKKVRYYRQKQIKERRSKNILYWQLHKEIIG